MIRTDFLLRFAGGLIILLLFSFNLSAQVKNARILQDTSPIRKAIINKQIKVNPRLVYLYGHVPSVDTVADLDPYLRSKQNCDYEKAIDSNGCVLVKYTDGFTKKICDGQLVEVVMPDGKKHVSRFGNTKMYMYVTPLPPPPNPTNSDTAFNWLIAYNKNLLDEISGLFADDQDLVSRFMTREKDKCNGSLYKEIEFRTIFIEEFLKAK